LIFSQWKDGLGVIARALELNNISFVQFAKETKLKLKKEEVVTKFQSDDVRNRSNNQQRISFLPSLSSTFLIEREGYPASREDAISRAYVSEGDSCLPYGTTVESRNGASSDCQSPSNGSNKANSRPQGRP